MITASLGIRDLDRMDEQDIETVKRAHLLLAMYNALQPGVFALSGWDLLGILPIAADEVEDLIKEGDTRWLNRGAHDLMGYFPDAVRSESGIPRGRSLYGSLPEQLADPQSFARQLARIIELRNKYGIATAQQIDIPTVSHKSLLVMVHELGQGTIQATVLNFSSDEISATIQSKHLVPGTCAIDVFDDNEIATVDELHSFPMNLGPYEGVAVVLR